MKAHTSTGMPGLLHEVHHRLDVRDQRAAGDVRRDGEVRSSPDTGSRCARGPGRPLPAAPRRRCRSRAGPSDGSARIFSSSSGSRTDGRLQPVAKGLVVELDLAIDAGRRDRVSGRRSAGRSSRRSGRRASKSCCMGSEEAIPDCIRPGRALRKRSPSPPVGYACPLSVMRVLKFGGAALRDGPAIRKRRGPYRDRDPGGPATDRGRQRPPRASHALLDADVRRRRPARGELSSGIRCTDPTPDPPAPARPSAAISCDRHLAGAPDGASCRHRRRAVRLEHNRRLRDHVLSFGERMSARVVRRGPAPRRGPASDPPGRLRPGLHERERGAARPSSARPSAERVRRDGPATVSRGSRS